MIEELTIANYALIEKAKVDFAAGLNVLTGETGAGKSILIGALGLLLGAKADTEVIRTGAEEAQVSGVFQVDSNSELEEWLMENGLSLEDGPLILRRSIRPQKRGGAYLAATPVTRLQLEQFTGFLVDLHGQHEHQSLFSPEHHRKLLDRYLGLEAELKAFAIQFQSLSQLKKSLEEMMNEEATREEEIFRLRQSLQEIEKAAPREGEEDELRAEKKMLDQHERLFGSLEAIEDILRKDRDAALSSLRSAQQNLTTVASVDPQWSEALQRFENAYLEIEDIAESLHTYQLRLNFSPERLDEINARLTLLHGLEKKFGPSLEGVLATAETARTKLVLLENFASEKEKAEAAATEQEKKVIQLAMVLSEKRQKGALDLEKEIKVALAELGMPGSQFRIAFQRKIGDSGKPVCSAWGLDQVEFLLSANPGEPVKPLKEIASGGELSRVTLAMKTILSDADNIPILIFDEIDTGIGGEMGQALGRYMKRLSRRKQVLCITHLASIASFADHHIKIEKKQDAHRTQTIVTVVRDDDRVREIARMLSGNTQSDVSLSHAKELIERNALGGDFSKTSEAKAERV